MSKVYCSNCGAEVVLPEKPTLGIGMTISKESKGDYVIPMKENNEADKKVNTNNGGNNMNNFSMEELVATVATVMKQMNGNQTALMSTATETKEKQVEYWAKNSKFYGKVMSDGHVFNPYLDRRFLPAQYLNMIKNEYNYSAHIAINNNYGYMYSIEWLLKEVDKLAFLGKVDPVAFDERKLFLFPRDIYFIVKDYVSKLEKEIDNRLFTNNYRVTKQGKVYLKFHGYKEIYVGQEIEVIKNHQVVTEVEKSDELKALIFKFNDVVEQLKVFADYTYQFYSGKNDYININKILQGIRFIELPYNTKKSDTFVDRFMAQGAFYTMRNLILFEGYSLKGKTGREAEELLRENIKLEGYKLHAMLKECMKDNRPDFMC